MFVRGTAAEGIMRGERRGAEREAQRGATEKRSWWGRGRGIGGEEKPIVRFCKSE